MHPNSELFFIYFDQKSPRDLKKTQVDNRISLNIMSLNPDSHYVFTLALEQCSATIALSHTIVTFGCERACSLVDVLHSTVAYEPVLSGSSPGHGTKATVDCVPGYSIKNQYNETNAICLDNVWVPSLPKCKKVRLCSFPRKPNNGQVFVSGLTNSSKAHYVCHKGFRLSGRRDVPAEANPEMEDIHPVSRCNVLLPDTDKMARVFLVLI